MMSLLSSEMKTASPPSSLQQQFAGAETPQLPLTFQNEPVGLEEIWIDLSMNPEEIATSAFRVVTDEPFTLEERLCFLRWGSGSGAHQSQPLHRSGERSSG